MTYNKKKQQNIVKKKREIQYFKGRFKTIYIYYKDNIIIVG